MCKIIHKEDYNTRVTLLEYLKQLHLVEWENFVKDTMILAEESVMFNGVVNPLPTTKRVSQRLTVFLSISLVSRALHRNLPFARVSGLLFTRRLCTGLYLAW